MFGVTEWLVIAFIVLLFFGASRLPGIGAGLGKGIRNFSSALKGADERGAPERGGKIE